MHATLNETFTAKYDGILPRTPEVRPESEIYFPKQDDEHPHPFHMQSPLPPPVLCIVFYMINENDSRSYNVLVFICFFMTVYLHAFI